MVGAEMIDMVKVADQAWCQHCAEAVAYKQQVRLKKNIVLPTSIWERRREQEGSRGERGREMKHCQNPFTVYGS